MIIRFQNSLLVAGMKWVDYSKQKGGLKQIIKENRKNATHKVVFGNKKTIVGLVKLARKKATKGHYSMAVAVLPVLGENGYAVVRIKEGEYAFLASINGQPAILGDQVGNAEKVAHSLANFLAFNDEPEMGWNVVATLESPADLESILPKKKVTGSQLQPLYNRKPLMFALMAIVLIWSANNAYEWWQSEQQRVAVAKAFKDSQERERKAKENLSSLNPWARELPAQEFLSLCKVARYNIPVSIAGWRLVGGRCLSGVKGAEGKSTSGPVLELGFSATDGRTAEEFRERAWYYLHRYPHFNLLEGGDTGTVSISLTKSQEQEKALMRNEPLPVLSAQLMRVVTHFQNRSQKVSFNEIHSPTPWKTVNFNLHSRQAPELLMQDLSDDGIRISSVIFSLSQKGDLEYDVKGTIYAK